MKKNVLLITLDQWRGDCLGLMGHPSVQTPHLDRFARSAVSFRRHFAQGAPCAPSRMSLYSSRYVFNHRVISNETPIDAAVESLPDYLRECGVDPWAAGHTSTVWSPLGRHPADPILVEPAIGPGWSTIRAFDGDRRRYLEYLHAQGFPRYRRFTEVFEGVLARTSDHAVPASPVPMALSETAWLVDGVIDHLRYSTDRSWGIHLSVFKPHPPFFPSAEFADRVPASTATGRVHRSGQQAPWLWNHPFIEFCRTAVKASYIWPGLPGLASDMDEYTLQRARRAYLALCEEVDQQVGRVLTALDESGQAERTLVIITADHGEMLGDQSLWGKTSCFPEAFHIPLMIRDPLAGGGPEGGRMIDDFTENVDILPTISEWLGREAAHHWDGQSLMSYLREGRHDRPRRQVTWEFDFRAHAKRPGGPLGSLDAHDCSLAAVLSDEACYIHFPALDPIALRARWTDRLDYEPADGPKRKDIQDWGRGALLNLRMRRADNRRTHLVQTPHGMRTLSGSPQQ
jgi:arylsulfatase A-like enzyme